MLLEKVRDEILDLREGWWDKAQEEGLDTRTMLNQAISGMILAACWVSVTNYSFNDRKARFMKVVSEIYDEVEKEPEALPLKQKMDA